MTAPDHLATRKYGVRRVTILGSTGSVGQNTVDLLLRNREGFEVEGLTANRNPERLAEQARALRARFAAIADPVHYPALKEALAGTGIATACGAQAIVEAAQRPADWVMAAIVGAAGLAPTLAAIQRGAIVALANKESLVCAGDLVMQEVTRCGATLLPVDSEHNAIWQCFDLARVDTIERIILTALRVAREALIRGGGCPTVLNAANETAVHAFLGGRIGFLEIVETVERTLDQVPGGKLESLDDVYNFDTTAREVAAGLSGLHGFPRSPALADLQ